MENNADQNRKEAIKLLKDALGRAENIYDKLGPEDQAEADAMCDNIDSAIVLLD